MKEIERYFRPEFIGRLDDVIVFRPLSRDEPRSHRRVRAEQGHQAADRARPDASRLTQEAKDFLIDKGTSSDFGARPLRRAIEQHVEDPLSEEILRGSFKGKDLIRITVKTEDGGEKHLYFEALTNAEDKGEKPLAEASSDAT